MKRIIAFTISILIVFSQLAVVAETDPNLSVQLPDARAQLGLEVSKLEFYAKDTVSQNVTFNQLNDSWILKSGSDFYVAFTVSGNMDGREGNGKLMMTADDLKNASFHLGEDSTRMLVENVTFRFFSIEGQKITFRFQPDYTTPEKVINFGKSLSVFQMKFEYYSEIYKVFGSAYSWKFDLSKLPANDIKNIYVRNTLPAYTLTPDPSQLRNPTTKKFQGMPYSELYLDLKQDAIMPPHFFSYRYAFVGSPTGAFTACTDRNKIPIPVEYRNDKFGIYVEVMDIVGNLKPYIMRFNNKDGDADCRVSYNSREMLAGDDDVFTYINPMQGDPFAEMMRAGAYESARKTMMSMNNQICDSNFFYQYLAVFYGSDCYGMTISSTDPTMKYQGDYRDIDMEGSGYQWGTDPYYPDYTKPIIPWEVWYPEEDWPTKGKYLKGYDSINTFAMPGKQEGYWCVVRDRPQESGEYYLHLIARDRLSGGMKSVPARVNANDLLVYKVDRTPPEITFEQSPILGKETKITFSDNHGLRAAAYQICPNTDSCYIDWHDDYDYVYVPVTLGSKEKTVTVTAQEIQQYGGSPLREDHVHARVLQSRDFYEGQLYTVENEHGGDWFKYMGGKHVYDPNDPSDSLRNETFKTKKLYSVVSSGASFPRVFYAGLVDDVAKAENAVLGPSSQFRFYADFVNNGSVPSYTTSIQYKIEGALESDWITSANDIIIMGNGAIGPATLKIRAVDGSYESEEIALNLNFSLPTDDIATARDPFPFVPLYKPTGANGVTVTFYPNTNKKTGFLSGFNWLYDTYFSQYFEAKAGQGFTAKTYQYYCDRVGYPYYALMCRQIPVDENNMGNIDIKTPIIYDIPQDTTQAVKAYLYVGASIKENPDISYENGFLTHVFNGNGTFVFDAEFLDGTKVSEVQGVTMGDITATVDWISKTKPNFNITYDITGPTNKNVTATLNIPPDEIRSKGYKAVNNNGSLSRVFDKNGSFTFTIKDNNGNMHDYTAEVNNIDKVPPVLTLLGDLNYPIYQGQGLDFTEPGYTAVDDIDGDITSKVEVINNTSVYKAGYQEIVYNAVDSVGNATRAIRGVFVYELNGIELLVNDKRLLQTPIVSKGDITLELIGQESPRVVLKYLKGEHTAGSFKEDGTVIIDTANGNPGKKTISINDTGHYTFYARDGEANVFVGKVYLQ